ncbi:MAG: hypothetical protein D6776_03200 [Planctomycetota bacterium]|nr:MAG: hypothetical protein D6776_03200 [Planctomycetota bacterium]
MAMRLHGTVRHRPARVRAQLLAAGRRRLRPCAGRRLARQARQEDRRGPVARTRGRRRHERKRVLVFRARGDLRRGPAGGTDPRRARRCRPGDRERPLAAADQGLSRHEHLTPLVRGDTVFTATYGGTAQLLRIDPSDGKLTAKKLWDHRTQGYMTSPVRVDGHRYSFSRTNRFVCMDLARGEPAWTSPPTGDNYWSLVARGDRLLALNDSGFLRRIAADPSSYQVLDEARVADARTWAHLAVAGHTIVVREQERAGPLPLPDADGGGRAEEEERRVFAMTLRGVLAMAVRPTASSWTEEPLDLDYVAVRIDGEQLGGSRPLRRCLHRLRSAEQTS